VDWYIISAKYGLINENYVIEPYDLSFNNMHKKDIRKLSKDLRIEDKLSSIIKNHNKVFFILGEKYLISIDSNIPQRTSLLKIYKKRKKRGFITPVSVFLKGCPVLSSLFYLKYLL